MKCTASRACPASKMSGDEMIRFMAILAAPQGPFQIAFLNRRGEEHSPGLPTSFLLRSVQFSSHNTPVHKPFRQKRKNLGLPLL